MEEIIGVISKPDVDVTVTVGFVLDRPMRQGDPDIEALKWTTKNKRVGSWEHFWNQHGMNDAIRKSEFLALVAGHGCQLVLPGATGDESSVEVALTAEPATN